MAGDPKQSHASPVPLPQHPKLNQNLEVMLFLMDSPTVSNSLIFHHLLFFDFSSFEKEKQQQKYLKNHVRVPHRHRRHLLRRGLSGHRDPLSERGEASWYIVSAPR